MNTTRATLILSSLVQGVDPTSGEELTPNSVLQSADVLRALLAGVTALKEQAGREARKRNRPANVGRPWTAHDESRLIEAFQTGETLSAIAEAVGRTLRAVEARLERLGLITPEQRSGEEPFIRSK
jgi:hypothetical protein